MGLRYPPFVFHCGITLSLMHFCTCTLIHFTSALHYFTFGHAHSSTLLLRTSRCDVASYLLVSTSATDSDRQCNRRCNTHYNTHWQMWSASYLPVSTSACVSQSLMMHAYWSVCWATVCICMRRACMYMHVCVRMGVCIHVHTYTHAHTHLHT